MKKILEPYLTPERGKIADDARTNYLIIKDTAEVIEKMKKIVEAMDTQTPQILITAKIVEIREEHIKEIGLANGIGFGYDPVGAKEADVGPGFSFNSAANPTSDTASGILGGITIGRFKRALNLGFNLKLMEKESKLRIVSSPKVVAQNKVAADISTTDTTSFKKSLQTQTGTEESWEAVSASMRLSVIPQVTNEGSIIMDINLSKESFDRTTAIGNRPPDKAGNIIKTNVLVDNGSTIVLGGVYTFEVGEGETGVPFLKDIPILGWLFKSAWNPSKKKNELMIFITPRIINQEEAGLISEEDSGA
jgi:type IV pilus assembly protein PilQ